MDRPPRPSGDGRGRKGDIGPPSPRLLAKDGLEGLLHPHALCVSSQSSSLRSSEAPPERFVSYVPARLPSPWGDLEQGFPGGRVSPNRSYSSAAVMRQTTISPGASPEPLR